jgi:hypothetical protein
LRERHLLANQAQLTASQISQVVLGGLRQSMLANHPALVGAVSLRRVVRHEIGENRSRAASEFAGPASAGDVTERDQGGVYR